MRNFTFFHDWFHLSIRNIKLIWRPFLSLLPPLFIPIFMFIVNSFAFQAVAQLPGFGSESYMKFAAPVAIFSAIFFSAGNPGIELALDMTTGYFKKLLILPISRLAIVLAKLSEVAIQSLIQGSVVLFLLYIFGIRIDSGLFGIILIFGLLIIFAMGWSCIGIILALLTQNVRLVQSLFIITFPVLYTTTSLMPKELLSGGYRIVVENNPATHILEGVRTIILGVNDYDQIKLGYIIAGIFFVFMVTMALLAFRRTVK